MKSVRGPADGQEHLFALPKETLIPMNAMPNVQMNEFFAAESAHVTIGIISRKTENRP